MLTWTAIPVVLHALLILVVFLSVEKPDQAMIWMPVGCLDAFGLALLGEPHWSHLSNANTATWMLLVGTVQWGGIGLVGGWLASLDGSAVGDGHEEPEECSR